MSWSPQLGWLLFGEKKELGLSLAQVSSLTGVDTLTLQNWANRGLLVPFPVKGRGDPRIYGSYEVVYITLAQALMQHGFALRSALVIAELIWGAFLEVIEPRLKNAIAKGKVLTEAELLKAKAVVSAGPSAVLTVEIVLDGSAPEQELATVMRFGPMLLDMATRALGYSSKGIAPRISFSPEFSQLETVLSKAAKRTAQRKKRGRSSS